MSENVEIEMKRYRNVPTMEEDKDDDDDDDDDDDEDEDEDELAEEFSNCQAISTDGRKQEVKQLWNRFLQTPKEEESISMADTKLVDISITILKLITYFVTFCGVLAGAIISKSIMLLMTSQLAPNKRVTIAQGSLFLELEIPEVERYLWVWALFASYAAPELGTFLRSLRHITFKSYTRQAVAHDHARLTVFVTVGMETLHVIGLALLVFEVLPHLDVVRGVMLTNCVCLVPSVLSAFSFDGMDKSERRKIAVNALAILFQLSGLFLWPGLYGMENLRLWVIPPTLLLVSCGWWMNYVLDNSTFGVIRALGKVKDALKDSEILLYKHYIWISLYKIVLFGVAACGIIAFQGTDLIHFFSHTTYSFYPNRTMNASELEQISGKSTLFTVSNRVYRVKTIGGDIWWYIGVQFVSSYLCYGFSKFSFKVKISSFSFSLPIIFVVPGTITVIIVMTQMRNGDPGIFNSFMGEYVFFNGPSVYNLQEIFIDQYGWAWLLWLFSQTWITIHVWSPKCERLSRTEKLFATPMYLNFLIDQSVLLNRRRDKLETRFKPVNRFPVHIIACATMWHESRPEMLEMLKSIMRMDQDHRARMSARDTLRPDEETNCYTYETHIFFDDAFEIDNEESGNMIMNSFVRDLIESMDKAAQAVYERSDVGIEPPQKSGTPYGGRLTYKLLGESMLYVHLKNKDKIRHRKRWSQVMYMYYLLGYNLWEKEALTDEEKYEKADNTFLLALDGDIDFKPQAVLLLVDLMRKNPNLGAACGRIHPLGSGIMVWYQMFEYAIGHWLQKATEHIIGCVLCSPGCFSLFRGKALMDDNVMKTYTAKAEEARHYVQYDQGEDRWLCTLLLQRGYRVEYSAASDAYTHCPESFNEFYTQRRRWFPSTLANILDLLSDYKKTIQINNDISLPFIAYQLMLVVGTVLGPGTIFLLLVSAFNAAFGVDNWTSFYYNMIPILLYGVICLTMPGNIQLIAALILSGIYGLIMMAVLVGMLLQISEDGFLAPSTIFLYIVAGEIIVAGIIHPREFLCLLYGPIYYVTIPSMYLLLVIYSVCNLNVVAWGTREVKQKKTKAELEEEKKEAEEAKKKAQAGSLHNIFGLGKKDKKKEEGAIEFSLGNVLKFMLFTHPKSDSKEKELAKISESIAAVTKKLDMIEKSLGYSGSPGVMHKSSSRTSMDQLDMLSDSNSIAEEKDRKVEVVIAEFQQEERDDLINPFWIEDDILKWCEHVSMDMNETNFWKELIEEYLYPLNEDKEKKEKISQALKELRDKMVVTFFMLNALFVTIVFLLQMNKGKVHLKWPLDAKINMTINENQEIRITKTSLELEPVGVMFIIFFAIILVIQFLAMFLHRFETLSHLLSSSSLWLPGKKKEKTFEMKVIDGKQKLLKRRSHLDTMSTTGRRTTRYVPNIKDQMDSIFSEMKNREEREMAEKMEKRNSSVFRRLTEEAGNSVMRYRSSHFRHTRGLERVVEEGSELSIAEECERSERL